jgi:hypothetical protein
MSIKCPRCKTNNPVAINLRENGTFAPHWCEECTVEIFGEVSSDEELEMCELMCEDPLEDEDHYIDEIGGIHDGGIGYNPQGLWCGECVRVTCKGCTNEHIKKPETEDNI